MIGKSDGVWRERSKGWHAEYTRQRRIRNKKITQDNSGIHPGARHGTRNGYTNLCCRCELCRVAFRLHMRKTRKKRADLLKRKNRRYDTRLAHGTNNCYVWHKCGCPVCRIAHDATMRLATTSTCKACRKAVNPEDGWIRIYSGLAIVKNKKIVAFSSGSYHHSCFPSALVGVGDDPGVKK